MRSMYIDRLEELCGEGKYMEIINEVRKIPEEERDYGELQPYLSKYLLHSFHGGFEAEDVVQEDQGYIVIPDWKVAVTPRVGELSHRSAVLHFYLYFPEWGREIYECSAGMGNDIKQAFGMAASSFLFSMMDGIGAMASQDGPRRVTAEFAGHTHRFQVYLSNIVGMGQPPRTAPDIYWEYLKDDIIKRLGNQAVCFVKIYGAKGPGGVTGECRIDDVKSGELSGKIAKLAEKWDEGTFASHKQFILIRQEEETIRPWPYAGAEGQERFREAVLKAARMFHEADTRELYGSLRGRLAEETGDATLAQECCAFLPELCAENAFEEASCGEMLEIAIGDGPGAAFYKSQLADYWPMWNVLASAFQNGEFGEDTDKIYEEYISISSIYDMIRQMQEKESAPKAYSVSALLYRMGKDFEIR